MEEFNNYFKEFKQYFPFKNIVLNILYSILIYCAFAIITFPIFNLIFELHQYIFFLPILLLLTFNHIKSQYLLPLKAKIIILISFLGITSVILVALINQSNSEGYKLESQIVGNNYLLQLNNTDDFDIEMSFYDDYTVKMKSKNTGEAVFNYAFSDDEIIIFDNSFEITLALFEFKIKDEIFECKAKFYGVDEAINGKLIKK